MEEAQDRKHTPLRKRPETRYMPPEQSVKERSCNWKHGIEVEGGVALDLSDRPLLSCALNADTSQIAVGSSDHAVYTVDCSTKQLTRTLYTKTSGHSEWVTCVTYTQDGRVVSGSMDQKLCLWGINSTRCMDLISHSGSISGVACFPNSIVSSSYDKRVKIWNTTTGKLQGTLTGHRAPVLQLVPSGCELIGTGDRGGSTFIWDLAGECLSWRLKKIHKGHITSIRWWNEAQKHPNSSKDCHHFLTGGQDGVLRLWDIRDHSNVFKEKIHGGVDASASINEVLIHPSNPNLFITCGADQTMKVLDLRNGGLGSVWEVALSDFPYSVELCDELVLCGCGDGSITVFDVEALTVKASLKPSTNAIRFIQTKDNQIICGGDEGKVFFFEVC